MSKKIIPNEKNELKNIFLQDKYEKNSIGNINYKSWNHYYFYKITNDMHFINKRIGNYYFEERKSEDKNEKKNEYT